VDGDNDIVDVEITPHQFRASTSRSPHLDGGPGNNNAGITTANNQQRLRAGVQQAHVLTAAGGDREASSSGSAAGEGMMTLDDFSDEDAEDGDFDPIARAYVPSEFGDDILHINGEGEEEGGVDELGGLGSQGSRGSGSNNVTMVAGAGEKRKRRTVGS